MWIDPDETVKRIAGAAFPDYRGRTFRIRPVTGPIDVRSYWDGGSRSYFVFVRLADMRASREVPAQSAFDPPLAGAESVPLPAGVVCVEHQIFCGKDMGIVIHARPDDLTPMLPPKDELTREEKIVLVATRSLKSSYGGIPNFRKHEAMQQTGIAGAAYDTAKQALIAKGCLNAAGAITNRGRNAIGMADLYQFRPAPDVA
jgi:hypothetical protein